MFSTFVKRHVQLAAASALASSGWIVGMFDYLSFNSKIEKLVPFAVGLLHFATHVGVALRTRSHFNKLFGINDETELNIVIPSYWSRVDYSLASDSSEYRFKKQYRTSTRYLVGATTEPLCDVGVATIVSILATELSMFAPRGVRVFGDEKVADHHDGSFFSVGSTTSNNYCIAALEKLPSSIKIAFDSHSMTMTFRGVTKKRLADAERDWAIVMRVSQETQSYLVCAGIDEEGSIATSRLVAKNWKSLPMSNFLRLYSCSKHNPDAIQLVWEGRWMDRKEVTEQVLHHMLW